MMRKLLLFILVIPMLSNAQESELGNWIMYFGNKKLTKELNWHHEVQYRNYDAIGDLEQLLLRTGIGKNLTEGNNNLLLGYGFILSENYVGDTDEKVSIEEHRIYQQFNTKQKWGSVAASHRYRFEQRFVESDFRMRFRYFLAAKVPLNNKEIQDKTFYAAMYNEIFLNTESSVFDRNRLYGGVGYKLNKSLRIELGYMNQYFEKSGRDQVNIGIFASY